LQWTQDVDRAPGRNVDRIIGWSVKGFDKPYPSRWLSFRLARPPISHLFRTAPMHVNSTLLIGGFGVDSNPLTQKGWVKMTVRHPHGAAMFMVAGSLLLVVAAQAADKASNDSRVIRVDSNMVPIPVSVTDPRNRPVVGIDARQFRVFEGKAEQEVVNVSTDDAPVSVGIVFDGSGSMAGKLAKAREAVVEFLKCANPDDEFFLVNFSSKAELAIPFTTSGPEIQNRLMYATTKGKTALLDAVYVALTNMRDARNPRKALLIISDGGDNDSRYTETEIRRAVRETGVWIYAIGVYAGGLVALPEEERGGPKLLTELAEETGGRHFAVHSATELPGAAAKIALELRNQYLLGYCPTNVEPDGKDHKVRCRSSWWIAGTCFSPGTPDTTPRCSSS
jgi:VWFA-related protein